MKITKLIMAAFVVATTLVSCSQEGPAGPTGPTGVDGLAGATGVTGPTGMQTLIDTGSLSASTWTLSSTSANVYYQQLALPNFTDGVNDVLVAYVQGTAVGADYYALPLTNFLSSGDGLSYSYSSGNGGLVTFYYVYTSAPVYDLHIKVAIIPPAVIKQHPGLNLSDYKAVMAALGQSSITK
jgi:hypothetical protein